MITYLEINPRWYKVQHANQSNRFIQQIAQKVENSVKNENTVSRPTVSAANAESLKPSATENDLIQVKGKMEKKSLSQPVVDEEMTNEEKKKKVTDSNRAAGEGSNQSTVKIDFEEKDKKV